MKILYLTPFNIRDTIAQSGTVVNIKKALEESGNDVITIDNLKVNRVLFVLFKVIERITGKKIDIMRTKLALQSFHKQIESRKRGVDYDIIFSSSSILLTYLKDRKPSVFYTDATFGGMLNYYWNVEEMNKKNVLQGMNAEKAALKNCTKAIFASQWAVDTAIQFHDADSRKCVAINRGANIYHNFNKVDILRYVNERAICNQSKQEYRMLFVGRDWIRKGGPLALQIVKELSNKGYSSKLDVVGCQPNLSSADARFINVRGFLNKDIVEENKKLQELYLTSDFYLQPSLREAQGIAYAEASAFGLPVIAVNTGGVSDIVTNRNGILFNSTEEASCYVEKIIWLIENSEEYKNLSISTFKFYQEALNWNSVGKRITKLLEGVL
ncbi:glycosyltransferase family 4 protein [Peribacillus sp. NPDC097198]|uniref:glycosyltransferase family 4 protein n=1 Tax=Peribacillus sp. NPDC097198 TaxID=3364397 RepID=UPI0037FC9844